MVNRNSIAYRSGRLVGRVILIGLGYLLGKKQWHKKSFKDSFPAKK